METNGAVMAEPEERRKTLDLERKSFADAVQEGVAEGVEEGVAEKTTNGSVNGAQKKTNGVQKGDANADGNEKQESNGTSHNAALDSETHGIYQKAWAEADGRYAHGRTSGEGDEKKSTRENGDNKGRAEESGDSQARREHAVDHPKDTKSYADAVSTCYPTTSQLQTNNNRIAPPPTRQTTP